MKQLKLHGIGTFSRASGYKYNTVNDYATAIDLGSSATFTQTDLEPQQNHFLYVWAYGDCGRSGVSGLIVSTGVVDVQR